MNNIIHPTAIISEQAKLGTGNRIGPFVVIEDNVEIGDDNILHAGVVLRSGARLGNENKLHEHAVVAGEPQDLGFDPSRSTFVIMGNRNVLRESVTVHRATKEGNATLLGDDNYLMAQVHVAHDCRLNNRIIMAPNAAIGGHVAVDDRAFISGGVMIHQFVKVGRMAMIGGNSKIVQDVLPFMITDGAPARVRGMNLVGLKRAGFSGEDLRIVKQACKLFRSGIGLEEIIQRLREFGTEHTMHLADFISDSKRSFHR